jgi:predicted transcriptional regulator
MAKMAPLGGDLQVQVMQTLWRLGAGTVEDVRSGLPAGYRGAYTTVQTVLNRLAERGMISRTRVGRVIEYRPAVTESQYVARSIQQTLAAASGDARQAALAELIGGLEGEELSEIQRRASSIERRRGK